jgi:hypothetical protein
LSSFLLLARKNDYCVIILLMSTISSIEQVGAEPINIKWKVVRGDTATLRVDFLEDDETTEIDIDDWTFSATSYDSSGDLLDELTVTKYNGYVIVTAPSDLTTFWGNGYKNVVANLPFDVQIVTDDDVVWTPIIGTISVYSDITPGGL